MSLLKKLYTNPNSPACFSGVESLFREAKKVDSKIKKKDVKDFLNSSTVQGGPFISPKLFLVITIDRNVQS